MTQKTESVVTPGRFAAGLTFQQWMNHIELNKAKFEANYQATEVTPEQTAALRELTARQNGPARVLVLGEAWCPDVYRGLPVIVRMAEAAGWELRIFPRDENLDIADEFLKDGEFRSIPVVVFYTQDHHYICHWIERPAQANKELPLMSKLYEGRSREEAAPDLEAFQGGPVWAGWRTSTIEELSGLLRQKVG